MRNSIKVGKAKPSNFEGLSFPDIIYKYREAENVLHRSIITEQTAFFAAPHSFEDQLDCKIPIRYDLLNDDEIFDFYFQILKESHPEWDICYLRQQATLWSNRWLLRDEKENKGFEEYYWNELNERLGVLCLTADAKNISMWKKYSNDLNGFCIGFDPKIMFREIGGGSKVIYYDTLPIIKATDTIEYKIVVRTYSKLRKWEFEKEYRTQKFWENPADDETRKFKIPNSAYRRIIIGENVKKETQKEIIAQSLNVNPDIEIRKATLRNSKIVISSL